MNSVTPDPSALPFVDLYVASAYLLKQMAITKIEPALLERKVQDELRRQPRPKIEALASACASLGLPAHARFSESSAVLLKDLVRGRLVAIEMQSVPQNLIDLFAGDADQPDPARVLVVGGGDAATGVHIFDVRTGEAVRLVNLDRLLAVAAGQPLAWLTTDAPAPPDTPGFAAFPYLAERDAPSGSRPSATPPPFVSIRNRGLPQGGRTTPDAENAGILALGGTLLASHLSVPTAPADDAFPQEPDHGWQLAYLDELVSRSEANLEKVTRMTERTEADREHYERLERGELNFAESEMDSFIQTGNWHHAENAAGAMDRADMYGDFADGGDSGGD